MWMCNSIPTDYSAVNLSDFLNYNKLIDVYSSRSRLILDIVFRLNILPPPLSSSSNWQGRNYSLIAPWRFTFSFISLWHHHILIINIVILPLTDATLSGVSGQLVIFLSVIILIYVWHEKYHKNINTNNELGQWAECWSVSWLHVMSCHGDHRRKVSLGPPFPPIHPLTHWLTDCSAF